MFEIEQEFHFEAGHTLQHHQGRCHKPHGHSYVLIVKIRSETLIPSGSQKNMVIDFYDIESLVQPMIEKYFDHQWLNDSLKTDSPTVEFITKWIFDYLEPHLSGLYAITLHETHNSRGTYFKS